MLNITQSQRIDLLFAAMQDFFAAHPVGVLEAQQVIVPSHGVGVWLRYQLASKQGISARLNTDFFGTYQWTLFRRVLGSNIPRTAPFARQVIQWKLFAYFLAVLNDPAQHQDATTILKPLFERLQDKPRTQQRLLWKMAGQIAQVFANYVLYRPQWLEQWGRGQHLDQLAPLEADSPDWLLARYAETEHWQQFLWQQLFSEDFANHQAIRRRFWQILEKDPDKRKILPPSLTIFTVLQLPPSEFNFLKQLARYMDIQFLHYNPSQEYWADSVDPLWLKQFELKNPKAAALFDSRHPLLTRMGKQARDIFALLAELSGNEDSMMGQWLDLFPSYFPNTLLGQLQHDVLHLVQPQKHGFRLQPQDDSIQVHACHSVLRQLEVLREQLMGWLSADTSRQPADIVVFVPNLADIAPLVRTVFSAHSDMYLPIHITGVVQADAAQLWQAMLGRYFLLDGRFSIEDLLDWLALDAVQALYQLGRDEVQRLGELLVDAGFRRGFDALHLQKTLADGDMDSRFTLEFALNRLMLGIAMPVQALHAGVLAYVGVGRQDFELIGVLATIYNDLSMRRHWLTQQHDLQYWLSVLRDELAGDFEQAVYSVGGKGVLAAFDELQANLDATQSSQLQLPFRFVLDEIAGILDEAPPGSIPTGKITFSRLGTLRPLPYRLVVMLNLDSGVFPRRDPQNTFDLMSILPAQRGDRSRLIDDQGAFLDGLLLAQDACWLFYNGFDVSDTQPRHPSGTLQELVEFMGDMLENPVLLYHQIVHHHTLEPFELMNFQAASAVRLMGQEPHIESANLANLGVLPRRYLLPRSYQGVWSAVARNLQQQFPVMKWLDQPLDLPPQGLLSLDRIIRQLCRPASHFLSQSRVQQIAHQDLPAIFEPLSLNKLDEYHIRALHQQQPDQLAHGHLQAILPVGSAALAYWKKSQQDATRNRQRLQRYGSAETPLTQRLLLLDDWQLQVQLPEDEQCGLWLSQYPYRHNGQRQLRYWLEHLAWQIQRGTPLGLHSNPQPNPQSNSQPNHQVDALKAGTGERIIVLSDRTLRYAAVPAPVARQQLLKWLAVWQQASCEPWVLPPNLALHASGVHDVSDKNVADENVADQTSNPKRSSGYIKNMDGLLKLWLDGSTFLPMHAQTDCALHRDWQLILRGQNAADCFVSFMQQHAVELYQPIKQFSQVLEQ